MSVFTNHPATPPPDLPGRFAFLIAALLWVAGAHITKDRTAGPWLLTVWKRLNGIAQRIKRLAAQIEAGTVPPLRAGFTLSKPRKPPTKPPIVLPNNPMWLIRVIQPTAVYGVWLQQLLADPEMPAFLAAAPQLARILRPLCRALGVTPPPLPPRPPRPARPEPAAPAPALPGPAAPIAAAPGGPATSLLRSPGLPGENTGRSRGPVRDAAPGRPAYARPARALSARAGPRLKPA